jgi:hypothetical protein
MKWWGPLRMDGGYCGLGFECGVKRVWALFLSCNGDFDELFMDSLDSIILTDEKE